jgi:hypothetical protein
MATWVVTAFVLWQVIRSDNFLGLVQSQTEAHSKDMLADRIKLMYENLPRWFRFFAVRGEPDWTAMDCRFRNRDSRIKVFPQGAKQLRQYTPSFVLVDEASHQDEFEEALTAMSSFLEKDTKIIFLSSVSPSVFSDIAYGKRATEPVTLFPGNTSLPPERSKGIRKWNLMHGGAVLELHYSADPTKDYEWLMEWDKKVAGGIDGPLWMQEMELVHDAFSGAKVYFMFSRQKHVQEFVPSREATRYLSMDYGLTNPTAALDIYHIGDNEYGPIYGVFQEFYQSGLSIEQIKRALHTRFGPSGGFETEWIDPTTDQVREKDTKTHFHLFNNGTNARLFQRADNSREGEVLIGEWLHQGRLVFHPRCIHMIQEIETLRYEQWATDRMERNRNLKERVVKKDDHTTDALRYFANGVVYNELTEDEANVAAMGIQLILDELEMGLGEGQIPIW